MRTDDTGVETFISEDLLVSLGAIRMALSWVETDAEKGSVQARTVGIQRLDDELAALQLRSREVSRAMRYDLRMKEETPVKPEPVDGRRAVQLRENDHAAPHWVSGVNAPPTDATPRPVPQPPQAVGPEQEGNSQPAPLRQNGDLGHSIDELLISAMSEPRDRSNPVQNIKG